MVLINERDEVVYRKRLANDLTLIIEQLSGYQPSLEGIVVESTYNWYWLVDGLMEKGYKSAPGQHGGHPTIQWAQYTDDDSDARWLAHLLRLGVLPQGYIYPREQRPVRDLLRKRSQLVRQRTTNLLSIQNLYTRNTGQALSANRIKQLKVEDIDGMQSASDLTLAIKANLSVLRSADEQVQILEQAVGERVKLRPEFSFLKTVPGIGRFWMFQRQALHQTVYNVYATFRSRNYTVLTQRLPTSMADPAPLEVRVPRFLRRARIASMDHGPGPAASRKSTLMICA